MALVLAACRSRRTSAKILIFIAAGMALGLLTGTRLFEGMAVIAALMIAYGFSAIRKPNRTAFALRRFVTASFLMTISGVATYVSCLQLSGARQIAMFYFSAGLSPVITRIYPLTFLDKFFQIFIDPSFDTVHHPFSFRNAFQQAWSPSFAGWNMPLLLQAPILIYLLAALIPIAVGTFFFKRTDLSAEAASLRAALIVGISLLVGYTTSFVDGSPNLGSGMIRDYMPVIWCLAIAGAPSLSSLWISRAPKRIPLTLCGACIIMIAVGESAAAFGFWPTYAPRHIARAIVTPTCRNGDCTLSLSYANSRGGLWHETKDILLASIDCDGVEKRIALFGPNYHFHECPGAISGVVFPRLTGLGAQPIDNMPFGFTFRLPSPVASRLSATYLFGLGTDTQSLLVQGWSANEHGFVWSDAESAMISLPPQPFKPGTTVKIDLAVSPFIFGSTKQQRVMIQAGNLPQQQFVLSKSLEDVVISGVTVSGNGDLMVSLKFPDAASPISVGLSSDSRLLAVQLRRITVCAAP